MLVMAQTLNFVLYDIVQVFNFMLFPLNEQALQVIIEYDYARLTFLGLFYGSVELKGWCFSWPLSLIIPEPNK